ncbi:16S/23S rRNA (cytidine-2'-O)-methyltransferase TlyA [Parafrigoribacterium mesophilum]|uniref:TlyA family RNA methyltransferase n=1 Tax=Parafrigoribacterium mesophilum TaxID=433646 RepID=UPI0031FDCAC8
MVVATARDADSEHPDALLRLDAALAGRGLARSRTHAARLIADGAVTVDGVVAGKPSLKVHADQVIAIIAADHYVSRAAHKLIAALDAFPVEVTGRLALDVGASTGGFTQVLLERGARAVIALDVGHGQLSPHLADDPRVSVIEGFNARELTAAGLAAAAGTAELPDLAVADLSFISLRTVLPAVVATLGTGADYLVLIKPQFEVGRTGIREGIVRDPALREEAVNDVLWTAWDLGLPIGGLVPSPLVGTRGNHEYLVWLNATHGSNPTQWRDRVHSCAGTDRA